MAGRFSIDAVFRAVDRITGPVRKMQTRTQRFTRSLQVGLRKASYQVKGLRDGMRGLTTTVSIFGAAVGAAGADIVSTGAGYEQAIVNAASKFGMFDKRSEGFRSISDEAKRIGATTEFSGKQAAEGMNALGEAGFRADQAVAALVGVTDLATIGQLELGEATTIAVKSLGAFGLRSKDAAVQGRNLTRVTDVIAATTTGAATNVAGMFEAIKDGAPVMTAAGQSLETTATLIGVMANAAVDGTRAGTALKNISIALTKTNSNESKILRRLGVDVTDSTGKIRQFTDIFADMSAAMAGRSDVERVNIIQGLFGKIPFAAALNILKSTTGEMQGLNAAINDSAGLTRRMAGFQRGTLLAGWKGLLSVLESVKIQSTELAQGPLTKIVDKMTQWVRANKAWIATGISKALGFVADHAGKIAIGFGVLVTATSALSVALGILAVKMALVTLAASPWILISAFIISAMTLIGAAVYKVTTHWNEFLAVLLEFGAVQAMVDLWDGAVRIWDRAVVSVTKLGEAIDQTIGVALRDASETIDGLLGGFSKLGASMANSSLGRFLGLGDDDSAPTTERAQVVSSASATAGRINETRSSADVTIRDETGRATMENQKGPMAGVRLQYTGAFQ